MCTGYILGIQLLIGVCAKSVFTLETKYEIGDIKDNHDTENSTFDGFKDFVSNDVTVNTINDKGVNKSTAEKEFKMFNVSLEDTIKANASVKDAENNKTSDEENTFHKETNVIVSANNISHNVSEDKILPTSNKMSLSTQREIVNTTDTYLKNNDRSNNTHFDVTTVPPNHAKTTHHHNVKLPFHVPYMIHGETGSLKALFLEGSKRATLKHHLQLVPMEDEPLGAMMKKDQRYVISVLVPIAIGVLGAALIAGTVFSLRYIARRRALDVPFDDDLDIDRDQSPCVPSISGDTTDKVFLLIGDDE